MVFTEARNPNKPTVGPIKRPGIRLEQRCHLWRSGFRYYLWAHLTFGDQLRECQARQSIPLFEAERYNFDDAELQPVFWQPLYKCGTFLCFVVADWRIRDSGGLAINRNSHFFYVCCQSCKCYFSWSCLLLQYQWQNGTYCI